VKSSHAGGGFPVALMIASIVLILAGCERAVQSRGPSGRRTENRRDDLFDIAAGNLNQLEEYETAEVFKQTLDRLNQWIRDEPPIPGWKPDPLLAGLPEQYRSLPPLSGLEKREFRLEPPGADGTALQEAFLVRDVSNWARGDHVDDIPRAKQLFDWTIRNIQLEPDAVTDEGLSARVMQTPWETLMTGQGTAAERAWVFILLARQQGLDAALVRPAELASPDRELQGPWLVGVLSKGEVYLFETEIGLPIPAPDGKKRGAKGELDIEPATLRQVAADSGPLRQLDADFEHPYPLNAKMMESVTILLESSPACLSQRMKLLESRLAGADKATLTTDASAQAARFRKSAHVKEARLWLRPYETMLQEVQLGPRRMQWQMFAFVPFQVAVGNTPVLMKGRMFHLKGRFSGDENATQFYQMARLSNRELDDPKMPPETRTIYLRAKLDASYWLGLIAAHQDNAASAQDYLTTRTQEMIENNRWTHGARYNLARVYEAGGNTEEAVKLYRSDTNSPAFYGNMIRARWLESVSSKGE